MIFPSSTLMAAFQCSRHFQASFFPGPPPCRLGLGSRLTSGLEFVFPINACRHAIRSAPAFQVHGTFCPSLSQTFRYFRGSSSELGCSYLQYLIACSMHLQKIASLAWTTNHWTGNLKIWFSALWDVQFQKKSLPSMFILTLLRTFACYTGKQRS